MPVRISPAAVGRPVEDIERVYEEVRKQMREHHEAWGPWNDGPDVWRRSGMFRALHWLDGVESVGPILDGAATGVDRVRREARAAHRAAQQAERRDPGQQHAGELAGVAELLDYAAGVTDTLPGFVEPGQHRAA